jgi:hypothetical protein
MASDGLAQAMMSKRRGRQWTYRPEIADEIIARLSEGESLQEICRDAHMPPQSTVKMWVLDRPPPGAEANPRTGALSFADRYARARAMGYETLADQVILISDEPILFEGAPDNAMVQHARLRAESRKWMLSKMLPKQFGDKVTQELVGDSDRPLVTRIELVPVDPRPIVDVTPTKPRKQRIRKPGGSPR